MCRLNLVYIFKLKYPIFKTNILLLIKLNFSKLKMNSKQKWALSRHWRKSLNLQENMKILQKRLDQRYDPSKEKKQQFQKLKHIFTRSTHYCKWYQIKLLLMLCCNMRCPCNTYNSYVFLCKDILYQMLIMSATVYGQIKVKFRKSCLKAGQV